MSRSSTLLGLLLVLAAGSVGCTEASAETPSHTQAMRRPPPPDERVVPSLGLRAELVDGSGRALPAFLHGGRRFVMGELGERYRIRVVNPTSSRVEAVVSVDGLDVLDGRPATTTKRGYIIPAFGETTIEGFRTSMDEVAAFRFSSVRDAYASRKGDDRNVGVIGVAFFRERAPEPPPVIAPRAGAAPAESEGRGARRPESAPAPKRDERPGLGTAWGEQRDSRVRTTAFDRESGSPVRTLQIRYDDREGLRAAGVPVDPPPRRAPDPRDTAEPFPADRRFAQPPP